MFQMLLVIIYLAFISLGLPDSLLGASWPSIYIELNVPISFAGIISIIIAFGTIVASLLNDKISRKISTGKITAFSVLLTAIALLGFSLSNNFILLCLFAIPYGLGAGSVDASLNNYVAIHYSSKHMSWLHCMWGIGTIIGPFIMSFALSYQNSWNNGFLYVSIIQLVLTIILFLTLPIWKNKDLSKQQLENNQNETSYSFLQILKKPGVIEILICFFCYCGIEQTTMLWAGSYLNLFNGLSKELSASLSSLFFIGITFGRFINGFLTMRFKDKQLIRLGQVLIVIGILFLFLPFKEVSSLIALIFIGLGCAPIYPSIIHSTPNNFGVNISKSLIGVQMASAYIGTLLIPPLFGMIAEYLNISLLPIYLIVLLILMIYTHEKMLKKIKALTH